MVIINADSLVFMWYTERRYSIRYSVRYLFLQALFFMKCSVYAMAMQNLASSMMSEESMRALCPCGTEEVETIDHVLLGCVFYDVILVKFIQPYQKKHLDLPYSLIKKQLLADSNPQTVNACSKFLAAAIRVCKDFMKEGF